MLVCHGLPDGLVVSAYSFGRFAEIAVRDLGEACGYLARKWAAEKLGYGAGFAGRRLARASQGWDAYVE